DTAARHFCGTTYVTVSAVCMVVSADHIAVSAACAVVSAAPVDSRSGDAPNPPRWRRARHPPSRIRDRQPRTSPAEGTRTGPALLRRGLPWVDQFHAGTDEIAHVAGGQASAVVPTDRRDLRIGRADQASRPFTCRDDGGVVRRGTGVERQDPILEVLGEQFADLDVQHLLPPAVGEPGDAVTQ